MRRFVAWLVGFVVCRHHDASGASLMYRERRPLRDARDREIEVLHLVCTRCGHAQPMVDRSPKDQKRVVAMRRASNRVSVRRSDPAPVVRFRRGPRA